MPMSIFYGAGSVSVPTFLLVLVWCRCHFLVVRTFFGGAGSVSVPTFFAGAGSVSVPTFYSGSDSVLVPIFLMPVLALGADVKSLYLMIFCKFNFYF